MRKTHVKSDKRGPLSNYKLVIEYEGTRYQGWQIQPGSRTIMGTLLSALESLFPAEKMELYGAGRTDKGVHALAQTAHLKMNTDIPVDVLRFKMNDILPYDITVKTVRKAGMAFHARHDALARAYIYQIALRKTALSKNFVWWIKDQLDIEAMQNAVSLLNGKHDFANFSDQKSIKEATRIHVFDARVELQGELLLFYICADHFLWKMVRKVTSFLVEIGRKHLTIEQLEKALSKEIAFPDIPTAPPSGLFLEKIYYRTPSGDEGPIKAVTPLF